MSDYPQLTEMGIRNPHQIRTYKINSISGIDVLRVVFKRPDDSFLPNTSSYEFPRVQRTIKNSKGEEASVLETAPALRAAEAELKALITSREKMPERTLTLLEELESLETELSCRIDHIRSLLKDT